MEEVPVPQVKRVLDNASILLKMENGSTGVISYFANGSKAYSKERVEVFSQDGWRWNNFLLISFL